MIQILARRTKNNPILLGEPGVGKTAIAEGLAYAIVQGCHSDGTPLPVSAARAGPRLAPPGRRCARPPAPPRAGHSPSRPPLKLLCAPLLPCRSSC